MPTQNEIRQEITRRVVSALEAGTVPWRRPWCVGGAGGPANAVSQRPYSGVNPLLLQMVADGRGYTSRWWATFQQWDQMGLRVMARPEGVPPGEWGVKVVLCKPVVRRGRDDRLAESNDGPDENRTGRYMLLRQFAVFNAHQVEGAGVESYLPGPAAFVPDFAPAEEAIRATGATIRHVGGRAYYNPSDDVIVLPRREAFESPAAYYQTAFHEAAHWTGHPTRLNRLATHARYGDAAYAAEELTAEIAGCYVCNELGVPQSDDLSNHAAYLGEWLAILRADPTAIFAAANRASTAADYVLAFSRSATPHQPDGMPAGGVAAGIA